MDPNKYYYEERDTLKNWGKFLDDSHERNNQMWNSILYNQFVNEEVRRLNRKIYYIRDDLKRERIKNDRLNFQLDGFKREKEKEETNNKKRKISDTEKWIKEQKNNRPRKYKKLNDKEIDSELKTIFSNLKNIEDIVEFENHPNRFDFFKNSKFERLYKLIPSCKDLKNIIGMEKVKSQLFKQIGYFLHGLNNSEEINHVIITGEPGVGKTTLAKIISKIYLSMGFLKNEKFIEAKRSDLIGQYCGHTAIKTQKVINSADGGVLFIDEVYSLGNREKRDAFTKECIDTINQNLTEKTDKFLCIVAGYKDDVKECFLDYNKGLERRFPIRFELESYSEESLLQIMLKFIRDEKWSFEENKKLLDLIKENKDILKFQAGDIRTIFQFSKENYSSRLFSESIETGSGDKILNISDFEYAFKKFKDSKKDKEIPEYLKSIYI